MIVNLIKNNHLFTSKQQTKKNKDIYNCLFIDLYYIKEEVPEMRLTQNLFHSTL